MPLHDSVKRRIKDALSLHSSPRYSSHTSTLPTVPPVSSLPLHPPSPLRAGSDWASPFTRLPLEIQAEIFGHCPTDFPRIDSQVPPLTLALVCKTWYYLVTTTPRLWSCFEIVLEGTGSSLSLRDDMTKRIQLWLYRSRQHPLSFRIVHNYNGGAADRRSAQLFTILLPHAPRWQNVQFRGPSGALTQLPAELQEGSLPALHSLSMHLNKSWDVSLDPGLLRLPWSQLSELDLQIYQDSVHTLDECFKILSTAHNLTTCTLSAECVFTFPGGAQRIALPSLKSLKLITHGEHPAAETSLLNFLELLSVVNLQGFSLDWLANRTQEDTGSRWEAVHPRFTAFLHSSAHSLESLGLAYLPLNDDDILSCLDGLSGLKALDLKFALATHQADPITEDFLEYLIPANSYHLPSLRSLKLQCSGEDLDHSRLRAVIESRAVPGGLKDFELLTTELLSRNFREQIAVWRSQGFNFSTSAMSLR